MLLDRIVESRLEFVALTNAVVIALTTFGLSLSEEQQMAVIGLVNAVFIVAWRLAKGTPTVLDSERRTSNQQEAVRRHEASEW